jgi:hypothetical protein
MRSSRRTPCIVLAAAIAAAALWPAEPSRAAVAVSIGAFHDGLSAYGTWSSDPRFGQVWAPTQVSAGWRPYTVGSWVYTAPYGWLWVEQEPWGWATYHYGRWFLDPARGWLWIPGFVWAPAWVSWRSSDAYFGWAPLGPPGFAIDPPHWNFVASRDFLSPHLGSVVVAPGRNVEIFRGARPLGRRGFAVARIEQATHTRIRPFQVHDAPDARTARIDPSSHAVQVFRPDRAGRVATTRQAAEPERARAPQRAPAQRTARQQEEPARGAGRAPAARAHASAPRPAQHAAHPAAPQHTRSRQAALQRSSPTAHHAQEAPSRVTKAPSQHRTAQPQHQARPQAKGAPQQARAESHAPAHGSPEDHGGHEQPEPSRPSEPK